MKAIGTPLRPLNFHDDAMAVIANRNRVSVWHDYGADETPVEVVPVRTKRARPQYL